MNRSAVYGLLLTSALAVGFWFFNAKEDPVGSTKPGVSDGNSEIVSVVQPETFSTNAKIGKLAFDAKCAVCHGTNAAGQDGVAPPLVHKIYEPSHHGDASFLLAAKNGVRAHHWRFGNMPPVEGITDGDVKMIVAYVRELQRANGIN